MKGPVDTSIIRRTRLKSNRRARHRRTRWLILFVAVITMAVGGGLLLHLKSSLESFGVTPRSAGQALAYEAARSFDKVLIDLAAPNTVAGALEERFAQFRALVEELDSEQHASMREPGQTRVVPEPLRALVERTSTLLDAGLTPAIRSGLLAEYQQVAPLVDKFTTEFAARTAEATAQRRAELVLTIVIAGSVATVLMLGLIITLLMVLRQQDRLQGRTEQLNETARALADAQRIAGVGTFYWDFRTDRVRWSEQLAEIYGLPPNGQATGKEFRSMLHAEDKPGVEAAERAAAEQSARSGEPVLSEQEYRIRRADGEIVYVAGVREIMADEQGRIEWMTSSIRDVTEERRQRRALTESERSLAQAQRIAHLGSFWVDLRTGATRWSDELKRVTGIANPPQELAAAVAPDFVHPDDREALMADMQRAVAFAVPGGSRQFPMQHRIIRPDGSVRYVRGAAEYSFDPEGQPRMLIGSLQDVTEEHERERALEEAKAAAEQANAAKSEFLAVMSHELRTPMNGVIGMLSALDETEMAPEQKRLATVARNSADALLVILNDILDLSKIEAGRLELETTKFELQPLLRSVVHLYAQQARAKGITLDSRMADNVPAWLEGDAARLRQMLLNLISNAVKFTAEGGVMLEATGRALPDGRFALRLNVRDTGVGIPFDKQDQVFTSFNQLDRSYARRFGGTGLGLAISRRLAELMGGKIAFESVPGIGTTFWIEVPLTPTTAGATSDAATGEDLPQMKILVAEDNATNQLVARMMLENLGQKVDVADNGLAAVEAMQTRTYDLVLMDLSMPVLDGIEATRRIRAMDGPAASVPIIALTANAMQDDIDACLAAGMSGFLSKPIIKGKLEAALAAVPEMRIGLAIPPAQSDVEGPMISAARLAELIGEIGVETIPDLMVAYRSDIERNLAVMKAAVAGASATEMGRSAHSLKGMALNLGATGMAERMARLEDRCRAGATIDFAQEYEEIVTMLGQLGAEVEAIQRKYEPSDITMAAGA